MLTSRGISKVILWKLIRSFVGKCVDCKFNRKFLRKEEGKRKMIWNVPSIWFSIKNWIRNLCIILSLFLFHCVHSTVLVIFNMSKLSYIYSVYKIQIVQSNFFSSRVCMSCFDVCMWEDVGRVLTHFRLEVPH